MQPTGWMTKIDALACLAFIMGLGAVAGMAVVAAVYLIVLIIRSLT